MQARTALVIAEGVIAGIVGHIAIALVLMIADVVEGRWLLSTPALLGSALFEPSQDICQVGKQAAMLLAYTSVHMNAMAIFGVAASYLINASEQRPMLWFGAVLLFIGIAWHLSAAVLTVLGPVRGCLSLYWIVAASFAGAIAMGAYLWRTHAGLRARLRTDRYA